MADGNLTSQSTAPLAEGVVVHVDWERPDPASPEVLWALDQLRPKWVRIEVPWSAIQKNRKSWSWSKTDQLVRELRKRNCGVIGILGYWAHWVTPYTPEAMDAFRGYAAAVSWRYRHEIQVWEVWNEPNSPTYWQSTPAMYVSLLRSAHLGVKSGAPQAKLLGGSLSGADADYLQLLLAAGAARYMDALSVHPYTFGWLPEDSHLRETLRGMSKMMAQAGKDPNLWITEFGIQGKGLRHGQVFARCSVLVRQSGVAAGIFWYCLAPPGPSTYSLFQEKGVAKSAVAALAEVERQTKGMTAMGSALPGDHLAPWGAGTPFSLVPSQSWLFANNERSRRVTWVPGGRVSMLDGAGHRVYDQAPVWEEFPASVSETVR